MRKTAKIKLFVGADAAPYVDDVCRLRIEAFRDYPYLYVGDLEAEKKYAEIYASNNRTMIAVAFVNDQLAGISTGMPVDTHSGLTTDLKAILNNADFSDYYYYGELIVLPKFRGLGLGKALFEAQDELIKSWGFKHALGISIIRENGHPCEPKNYKPLDLQCFGFKHMHQTITYTWPTLQANGSVQNSENTLELWKKNL